uniref:Uncharacterized protein n=1 Tax=Bacteriophage sp. TaxID=38018 RepID=A0A8D9UHQ1_9VIRU|nr:MAG TPA: hypothetical protein [Bacteriophage sp.]
MQALHGCACLNIVRGMENNFHPSIECLSPTYSLTH